MFDNHKILFWFRINTHFTCSRCLMCVSCSVHVISTYYVCKGSWAFFKSYPQIHEVRKPDDMEQNSDQLTCSSPRSSRCFPWQHTEGLHQHPVGCHWFVSLMSYSRRVYRARKCSEEPEFWNTSEDLLWYPTPKTKKQDGNSTSKKNYWSEIFLPRTS